MAMPVRANSYLHVNAAPVGTNSPEGAQKSCIVEPLLEHLSTAERRVLHFKKKQKIYTQGELADSVYYLQKGRVKISVLTPEGKEATISLIGAGEFFGETCLTARPHQVHTATAMTDCTVAKITRPCMVEALHQEKQLSEEFLAQVLNRNIEYQQAITDHIVASSEQRLAAILIRLCRFAQERDQQSAVIPRLSHQTLADMIGTTRPRVTFFMNKFRKLGLLEYNGQLRVNLDQLSRVVLGQPLGPPS
jgi:CRP/FNR family cyclic AMP-dependent transcriptional regulator